MKDELLVKILLKLSAVTDTGKLIILASLAAHFVNFKSFHPVLVRLVLNMAGIIPGEICDQFGVKF